MRVLIADDDRVQRAMLEVALAKWGYEVTVTCDGDEAWQALQRADAPRLAILDWMMPGVDGVQICRRIRERADMEYTYILLLTAKGERDSILEGMEAGADDYLTKPFDPAELQARLRAGIRILTQEAFLLQSLEDHRRAQVRLAQERNLLRNLIDNIPDQVYIKDMDGRYIEVNVAHMRLLGATVREEVLGKTTAEFLPPAASGLLYVDHQAIIHSAQPLYDQEETVIDWMGNARRLATTMLPLQDAQGQVVALICLSRNLAN